MTYFLFFYVMQTIDRHKFNSSKANSIIVADLASTLNIAYKMMKNAPVNAKWSLTHPYIINVWFKNLA